MHTAQEEFEAQKRAILALLLEIPKQLRTYDRAIEAAGTRKQWDNAGTLQTVVRDLENALGSLTSATENTQRRPRLAAARSAR